MRLSLIFIILLFSFSIVLAGADVLSSQGNINIDDLVQQCLTNSRECKTRVEALKHECETNPAVCASFEEKINEIKSSFIQSCIASPEKCDCAVLVDEEAVRECETNLTSHLKRAKQVAEACFADPEACDCAQLEETFMIQKCEEEKEKYYREAQAVILSCIDDPDECDCSKLPPTSRARCEAEVGVGKMVKKQCQDNLEECDCSPIENDLARQSCENAKAYALEFRNKFQKQCEENLMTCDCSTIPSSKGREECEKQKKVAIKQSQEEISRLLDECFKNPYECNCSTLPKPEYVAYCEEQLGYGLTCMKTGQLCDKLDENVKFYPPGLPEFLRPFFAQSLKQSIQSVKDQAVMQASRVAQKCVIDPEACDCSGIPDYAQSFCLEKKNLQLQCILDKNVTACMILDASIEVVPPETPGFIKAILNPLLRPLVQLQKEQIKGKYASETKDLILSCIDDINACDCSKVPMLYRSFCEAKVSKVKACYAKDYEVCFQLVDEPNIPDDIPFFIRVFVEGDVNAAVNAKINEMFEKLKPEECAGLSLEECREVLGY